MKTFVINLERSTQRREHILSEVTRRKLDYEFIKAVDGALLSEAKVSRLIDAEAQKEEPILLTRGTLGCLLSHLKVYERIVEENLDMAFVLEDDAILPEDIHEILDDVRRSINRSEVVLLYFYSFTPCELSEENQVEMRGGRKLMFPVKVDQPVTASAYVITREAAQTLLKLELPMKKQCDAWGYLYKIGGIESFRCVYPPPVSISGAKSTIQPYVQSGLRVKITKFFDDNYVPLVSNFFKKARLNDLESKSAVKLVSVPSPMAANS